MLTSDAPVKSTERKNALTNPCSLTPQPFPNRDFAEALRLQKGSTTRRFLSPFSGTLKLLLVLGSTSLGNTLFLGGSSGLLLRSDVDGRVIDEGHDLHATHERLKHFRHQNTVGSLVVLQDAADGSLGGTQSGVQHVNVLLLLLADLLDAVAGLHGARLVVSAVGGRHQFAEDTEGGEPSLQVELLGGSVVQFTRNYVDGAPGQAQLEILVLKKCVNAVVRYGHEAWTRASDQNVGHD